MKPRCAAISRRRTLFPIVPPSWRGNFRLNNEFAGRRKLVETGLVDRKIDALLVSSPANVRYLAGFTGSNGALLILPGGAIFFTDPRYAIQAGREVSCQTMVVKGPLLPAVAAVVTQRRIRRLGFERGHLSYDGFDTLRARLPVNTSLEPVAGWLEGVRMVKSEGELALIESSVATNSKAFEQAVRRIRSAVREQDLAAEIEYRMKRRGAQGPAFDTIVASGPRGAWPHARASSRRLRRDELVILDLGAILAGYAADMTRTVYLGVPTRRARELYESVAEAQRQTVHRLRAGMSGDEVDTVARQSLASRKLADYFTHSTGHGVGLDVHERPRLGRGEKALMPAGSVVTVEPGVYLEGYGGVRIEDTVLVSEHEPEILTPAPRESWFTG